VRACLTEFLEAFENLGWPSVPRSVREDVTPSSPCPSHRGFGGPGRRGGAVPAQCSMRSGARRAGPRTSTCTEELASSCSLFGGAGDFELRNASGSADAPSPFGGRRRWRIVHFQIERSRRASPTPGLTSSRTERSMVNETALPRKTWNRPRAFTRVSRHTRAAHDTRIDLWRASTSPARRVSPRRWTEAGASMAPPLSHDGGRLRAAYGSGGDHVWQTKGRTSSAGVGQVVVRSTRRTGGRGRVEPRHRSCRRSTTTRPGPRLTPADELFQLRRSRSDGGGGQTYSRLARCPAEPDVLHQRYEASQRRNVLVSSTAEYAALLESDHGVCAHRYPGLWKQSRNETAVSQARNHRDAWDAECATVERPARECALLSQDEASRLREGKVRRPSLSALRALPIRS